MRRLVARLLGLDRLERRVQFLERSVYGESRTVYNSPIIMGAVQKMLAVAGDHMTACDRVMGDSHPCTCGAEELRRHIDDAVRR